MKIRLDVYRNSDLVESYVVPSGSWIQTESCGAQYAFPVMQKTLVYEGDGKGVVCSPAQELPVIPEDLLNLVNSMDRRWGKNGFEWMGCHRENAGGTEIDRVREYAFKVKAGWMKDCPVPLDKDVIEKLCGL